MFLAKEKSDECPGLREMSCWSPGEGGQPSQKSVAVMPTQFMQSLHTHFQPSSLTEHLFSCAITKEK